jgi:hypothetical protein
VIVILRDLRAFVVSKRMSKVTSFRLFRCYSAIAIPLHSDGPLKERRHERQMTLESDPGLCGIGPLEDTS